MGVPSRADSRPCLLHHLRGTSRSLWPPPYFLGTRQGSPTIAVIGKLSAPASKTISSTPSIELILTVWAVQADHLREFQLYLADPPAQAERFRARRAGCNAEGHGEFSHNSRVFWAGLG